MFVDLNAEEVITESKAVGGEGLSRRRVLTEQKFEAKLQYVTDGKSSTYRILKQTYNALIRRMIFLEAPSLSPPHSERKHASVIVGWLICETTEDTVAESALEWAAETSKSFLSARELA
ncbi:hypothetical protein V9T40_013016 [Parthenolecanium corni]|uniref:Uncharacterized protein n=1 Tax=Parthenolecanium corni TaxID=536013 RepID=A0AAN9TAL0_9HEMI